MVVEPLNDRNYVNVVSKGGLVFISGNNNILWYIYDDMLGNLLCSVVSFYLLLDTIPMILTLVFHLNGLVYGGKWGRTSHRHGDVFKETLEI